MHSLGLIDAAKQVEASYAGRDHISLKNDVVWALDEDDVQALLLKGGTLLIPGSNSWRDYAKFNLRIFMIGGTRYRLEDSATEAGASGAQWHQGFLRHAKFIYDELTKAGQKPKYIVGHSLGAASAQILSLTWKVPAIGFAAPRPRRLKAAIPPAPLCLCINRSDDKVCKLPKGFHHLGKEHLGVPNKRNFGMDHSMTMYRRILEQEFKARKLAPRWPNHAQSR